MDPSPKRRKFFQRAQDTFGGILRFSEHPIAHTMPADKKDPLGKQLPLRAAMAESLRTLNSRARKESPVAGQGKAKPHRLHPRQLGIYEAVAPVVQPIQTTVVSYINVVLDSGGTSIGNVLVPAESTIFSVDGYGPVTLDDYSPPNPTPAGSPLTSRPIVNSNAAQQTIQPETQQTQQDDSIAVASPSLQSPMTIGSSSQFILSSPPTPLPPNPSSSTASFLSSTASESYFGSTSSRNPDSTQTPSASDITSSQSTRAASVPQGNLTTSCKYSRRPCCIPKTDLRCSCHFLADAIGLHTGNDLSSRPHPINKFHLISLLVFRHSPYNAK